jgi:hypothetical protein
MRPTARTETRPSPLWADLSAIAILAALALAIASF